jgi:uncharacterized protein
MAGPRFALGHPRLLSRRARRIAAGAAIAVLLVAAGHALRLAPRILGLLQVPEHAFLRRWATEYAPGSVSGGSGLSDRQTAFLDALADAAADRAAARVVYDPSYVEIAYPGGDVAPDRGVCTDLVVRAFRDVDVDLQRDVHVDMADHFDDYPAIWGSESPDSNIDHRRVPNLMVLFARHGQVLPITDQPGDYRPGDIVTWDLGRGLTHIGIVTRSRAPASDRPLVAHHVGGNPTVDDVLFAWTIIGHFRYFGLPGSQP